MSEKDTKSVGVVLSAEDVKIVKEMAAKWGLSFSAAVRMIIRQWSEAKMELPG